MVIKMLGVVMVITGFGGWGLRGAGRIQRRVKQINALRMAIGFLEKEITCMYNPLSRALENTAHFCQNPVASMFSEAARRLNNKDGVTAAEAWSSGIAKLKCISDMQGPELDVLSAAIQQLGRSDAGEQKRIFTLMQEELKILEEKAGQEAQSNQKLWSYGGFILGTIAVILLL